MTPTILDRATDGRPLWFALWYLALAAVLCAEPIHAAVLRVWGAM